ncbi:MAG: CoA transferase [Alphaproteobacteria bacterium]|nr:CoA transferase [Alphaproteobacteria bacterium]
MAGPLAGKRIVEVGGIGPCPFCGMLLADMGADVVRLEAPQPHAGAKLFPLANTPCDVLDRGKRALHLDLKSEADRAMALALLRGADGLIEGFRPGVMERLGLGPDACRAANPRLVYGRMSGFGQSGPLRDAAGHDINYIALAGVLHSIGPADGPPTLPLNLVGDYAGGGLLLAFAMVCAMLEVDRSGRGQVIDAAMSEGAALLMAAVHGFRAAGMMPAPRGRNAFDGGAHFYAVYECADGEWLALGALEPAFYATLLARCGITDPAFQRQFDPGSWSALQAKLATLFRTRDRADWLALLEGSDAYVTPVLSMADAPMHPQNRARGVFVELAGVVQPAPAPRFERTAPEVRWPAPARPVDAASLLQQWSPSP